MKYPENDLGRVLDAQTLRMDRLLPAPIEKVWAFLAEPDKRARWLAGGGACAKADDVIELRFQNDQLTGEAAPDRFAKYGGLHIQKSRVVRVNPPKLLVISWQEGSDNVSEVSFELSAEGDRTRLQLTHSRLAKREGMLSVSGGWHAHLDVLEDVLAAREPRPFWSNLVEKQSAYDRLIPAA